MTKQPTDNSLALGKKVEYSKHYDASILFKIERAAKSGKYSNLGFDRWLSYELTYLSMQGTPKSCAIEIIVPASTKFIVESKSLKLYLGSFSSERFASAGELLSTIKKDLESLLESTELQLEILDLNNLAERQLTNAPGTALEAEDFSCSEFNNPSAKMLSVSNEPASETLNTSIFRSLCPVTEQPDYATVVIEYKKKIEQATLFRYLVAYRNHSGFHETCCEKIFDDILQSCQPEELTVACYFNRRGGIEINPLRSTVPFDKSKYYCRLTRQ